MATSEGCCSFGQHPIPYSTVCPHLQNCAAGKEELCAGVSIRPGRGHRATRLLWAHLELGCLVEIGSTDTLPDDVPVSATRGQTHPLLHHDVLELSPHLPDLEQDRVGRQGWSPPFPPPTPPQHPAYMDHCPHLPHGLGVDEMIITPDGRVIIVLPLQVDIQVRQMIALGNSKLLPDLIALLLPALRRQKGLTLTRQGVRLC